MKFALIGCGRISANHVKAVAQNELEFVALCDSSEKNIDELVKNHGLESKNIKRYSDYRTMIAECDIDLAAIATPSGSHAKIAMDCIEKGINIIVEKPIAMSIADANEIIKRSDEKGVVVCACHQNRFNSAIVKLRDALEGGRFGRLSHGSIHVRWNRDKNYYKQASWRGKWSEDGGALMNQCIHGIDLLCWMFGDVDQVYGVTKRAFHDYIEAEDVGMAVVKFKNGAIATIEGTTNVYPKNLEESLLVFGENGTVKIGGKSTNDIEVWEFRDECEEDANAKGLHEHTENVYGNGHNALYADVIDAIKTGRKPYVDAEQGKKALEMVLAIYKSEKEGLPVSLPLEDFSSEQMMGEFA